MAKSFKEIIATVYGKNPKENIKELQSVEVIINGKKVIVPPYVAINLEANKK